MKSPKQHSFSSCRRSYNLAFTARLLFMIYVLSSARHYAKLVLGERRGGGGSGTEAGPELRRAHHQPRDPAQPPHHHAAARGHGAQRAGDGRGTRVATSHTPGLPGPRAGASGMAITCYNVMKLSYVFKNIFRLILNPYQNYKYNTTFCTKSESSSRRTFHHWPTFHQSQHSPSCPGCGSSPSRHRSESPGRGTRSPPRPGRGRRSPRPASGSRRRHSYGPSARPRSASCPSRRGRPVLQNCVPELLTCGG